MVILEVKELTCHSCLVIEGIVSPQIPPGICYQDFMGRNWLFVGDQRLVNQTTRWHCFMVGNWKKTI